MIRGFTKSQVTYCAAEQFIDRNIDCDRVFRIVAELEDLPTAERRIIQAWLTTMTRGSSVYLPVGTLQLLGIKEGKTPLREPRP